jgi:GR25 family glycosyltransferase involved in LPS biosynthesis
MIPVHVISLAGSTDRRDAMSAQLKGLGIPFRFFDAVDGRKLSPEQLREANPYPYYGQHGRMLSPSEIGCALSHIGLIRVIAEGNDAFACVLEDDVLADKDLALFLDEATLRNLPVFDVLRICNSRRQTKLCWYATHMHGRQILAPFLPDYFAEGMIYSREGARKIMQRALPLRGPIDNMLFRDGYIPSLRTLEVRPRLVGPAGTSSTMQKQVVAPTAYTRVRKKFFLLNRYFRTIRNFAGAWGVAALFRLRKKGPAV